MDLPIFVVNEGTFPTWVSGVGTNTHMWPAEVGFPLFIILVEKNSLVKIKQVVKQLQYQIFSKK